MEEAPSPVAAMSGSGRSLLEVKGLEISLLGFAERRSPVYLLSSMSYHSYQITQITYLYYREWGFVI